MKYETPVITILELDIEDIVTTSSLTTEQKLSMTDTNVETDLGNVVTIYRFTF